MSFAFRLNKDGQTWSAGKDGLRLRTITDFASLSDVSVVTDPAYLDTSAMVRGMKEQEAAARGLLDTYRKRLELAAGKRFSVAPDWKTDLMRRKLRLLNL